MPKALQWFTAVCKESTWTCFISYKVWNHLKMSLWYAWCTFIINPLLFLYFLIMHFLLDHFLAWLKGANTFIYINNYFDILFENWCYLTTSTFRIILLVTCMFLNISILLNNVFTIKNLQHKLWMIYVLYLFRSKQCN